MSNLPDAISPPRASGKPLCRAVFRRSPEDFVVNETLVFEPEGKGEHVYLYISKRGANTQWLARELARYAGIKPVDVSYAGLKDRHAVTRQWFSLRLPAAQEPDWDRLVLEGVEILTHSRHRSKLRPGMLANNRFCVRLYDTDCNEIDLQQRLQCIREQGVPNYYGEQRFGHDGDNIGKARQMFTGQLKIRSRPMKGLILSAARSYLFNTVLARRVRENLWHTAIAGDCMILDGTNSFFSIESVDDIIQTRLHQFDIHPSAPLWGKGDVQSGLQARQLELEVLAPEQGLCQGLASAGMKMGRKALRMRPMDLNCTQKADGALQFDFTLTAGQYATTLLHELFELTGQDHGTEIQSAE